jgi:hypothetical protein
VIPLRRMIRAIANIPRIALSMQTEGDGGLQGDARDQAAREKKRCLTPFPTYVHMNMEGGETDGEGNEGQRDH